MKYFIGFILGVMASILAYCFSRHYFYSYASPRGMSFYSYNCGTKLARFKNMGLAPLNVWIKVYKPEPSPYPGSDPTMVAGVVAASKNMDYWEASDSSWPNSGEVFVFGWYEQSLGSYGVIGPSKVVCGGGSPPPPSPPPPPPFGAPQKY